MTLYMTDLDGTLLRSDKSISEHSLEIINAHIEKGMLFSYATARSFASAHPLIEKLNISAPAVIFNGVFVVDSKTGEALVKNVYTKECMEMAKELFVKENISPLVYSVIDGAERVSYLENNIAGNAVYLSSRKYDKRLRPTTDYGELFKGEIFYFTIMDPADTQALDAVFCERNGFARNIQKDTYDDSIWYEIYDKHASKANAVAQVKKLTGADKLITFGDNMNDISMIKAADIGIAVENACEELKAAADEVIKGNDFDGVGEYIDKHEHYQETL